MAVQRAAAGDSRWRPRTIGQFVTLVVVASLLCLVAVQAWSATGDDLRTASSKRDGVVFLRPLNRLVAELVEAQSTSVRGGVVQTAAVRSAVEEVSSADRKTGEALAARQRWDDARKAVNDLLTTKPVGPVAFDQYSEVIALVLQLGRQVADSSGLVLDSDIGSYYLMDTAVIRLPEIIVSAGKAADLAVLAPGDASREDPRQIRVFVARYGVATGTEAVGVSLAKALDASDSRTVGTNITGQLDSFRSAVDAFVPTGTRLNGLDVVDAETMTRTAASVRQAARPLADAVLTELDSLLENRVGSLVWREVLAAGGGGLGVVLVIVMLGTLVDRRRARTVGPRGPAAAGPAPKPTPAMSARGGRGADAG